MSIGPFQILIILLIILVLFGRGRISETMGDFGKGIKSFKKGLEDGPGKLDAPAVAPAEAQPDRRAAD